MHGIQMPAGLVESQKLPQPIFTPSTKADQGEHDENIHPDKGEFVRLDTMARADPSQGDCRSRDRRAG